MKGRKIRSRSSCRMPGPESAISTSRLPFSASSESPTVPPSGVHLKAFVSRLEMTCRTRSPSETMTASSPFVSRR